MKFLDGLLNLYPCYEKQLTLEDLRSRNTEITSVTMKDKKNVKIAIIDDMGFDITRLNRLGFKDIKVFEEFEDLDIYETYDIIMCDINGIGKEMDDVNQGAAIAKMIKDAFPEKIVIVYSAEKHNPELTNYINNALIDDFINKNISSADLNDKLNSYISKLHDPVQVWERTRIKLYNHDVPPKTIGLMEHYYVKSFVNNKNYSEKIIQIKSNISPDTLKTFLSFSLNIIEIYLKKKMGG